MKGDGGVEALVVGVADRGADVDRLREGVLPGGEVEGAVGAGVDGEPVRAVDGLVVGGEGRGEVFVAGAGVLGDGGAVDEDDLVVLLREPDAALKVAVVFEDLAGGAVEDIGVELVDALAAAVGEGVVGELGEGEDEGEAVGDVVEIGGGEGDALEGVGGSEEDVLLAAAGVVEGDVGDLVIDAVGEVGLGREGFECDVLAEGVEVAGGGEGGFLLRHVVEELGDRDGGRRGVERAEAGLGLLRGERGGEEEEGEEEESGHGGGVGYRIELSCADGGPARTARGCCGEIAMGVGVHWRDEVRVRI